MHSVFNRRSVQLLLCSLLMHSALYGVDISPSGLQINIGAVPIDKYYDYNTDGSQALIKGCSQAITVQACIQDLFQDDTNNFVSQGVTGVRFFFTLGGGYYSTPLDTSGNLQSGWVGKFQQFLSDLKSFGIESVRPLPSLTAAWAATSSYKTTQTVVSCGVSKSLVVLKWLPYGNEPSNDWPDQECGNQSYNSSGGVRANDQNWWGWTPYFDVVDAVLGAAETAGLDVDEWEMENELNVGSFTVQNRLLYDNTHSVNVVSAIRTLMSNHGFASSAVTASVGQDLPTSASYDCGSFYGDSARLIKESTLIAAFGGAAVGDPPRSIHNNLECADDNSDPAVRYDTSNMIWLPTSWSQPSVTDIHVSTAYASGTTDTQTAAAIFYDDLWAFLDYRNLESNLVVLGESNPVHSSPCSDEWTSSQAAAILTGYVGSDLYSNKASTVIFRPWEDTANYSCVSYPNLINPPYEP